MSVEAPTAATYVGLIVPVGYCYNLVAGAPAVQPTVGDLFAYAAIPAPSVDLTALPTEQQLTDLYRDLAPGLQVKINSGLTANDRGDFATIVHFEMFVFNAGAVPANELFIQFSNTAGIALLPDNTPVVGHFTFDAKRAM